MAVNPIEAAKQLGLEVHGEEPEASPEATGAAPVNPIDAAKQLGLQTFGENPPEEQAPEEDEHGALAAAFRGLKRSFLPTEMSKAEVNYQGTLGENLTEAGTSILADIGTGAAIGAVAGPQGALVGGVLAPIAMAIYRGFGYEKAYSRAKGEDYSVGRALLSTATDINPLLSKGSKLAKFASQAGLEAANEMAHGGNATGAAFAGALGGGLSALFHKQGPGWFAAVGEAGSRPTSGGKPGMSKELTDDWQRMLDDASDAKLGSHFVAEEQRRLAADPDLFNVKRMMQERPDDFAGPHPGDELSRFKRWLVDPVHLKNKRDDIDASFDHFVATKGEKGLQEAYEWFKRQEIALDVVDRYNRTVAGELTSAAEGAIDAAKGAKDPLRNDVLDKVRDIKFVARKMDRVTGLDIDGTVDKFTDRKQKMSVIMAPLLERANTLYKQGRKIGLQNEKIGKYLASDEAGARQIHLTPEELEIAEGWRKLFADTKDELEAQGLHIDHIGTTQKWKGDKWQRATDEDRAANALKKYFPNRGKGGADMHKALRAEIKRLQDLHGADYLETKDAFGLKRVVAHLLDDGSGELTPDMIRTSHKVEQALDKALDPRTKLNAGYEAFASFKREGAVIPEFAREWDVGKSFLNYLNTNMKSALFADVHKELQSKIAVLHALEFKQSAQYLERYLDDVSGIPSDRLARMQQRMNEHKVKYDKLIEGLNGTNVLKETYYRGLRDLPDFVGFAIGQIYPNFLGWNLRAALRNFTQPMLTTAPELGWGYGSSLVGKATAKAAQDFGLLKNRGNVKASYGALQKFLQDKDLAPGKYFGHAQDITQDSMRSKKGVGAAMEGLDKWNDLSMSLYGASDVVNRYITYQVGLELAKDAAKGNKRALAFIGRLGEGDKLAARKLIAAGKQDQLGDLLARRLIAKTQFNYGRESMNEFGREFGRLFSMFTKWPAMIYSDSAEQLERYGKMKGSAEIARKYMAPMALLFGVSELADMDDNPWAKWLIGTDLADIAPAQSYALRFSPVAQTGGKAVKTLLDVFNHELSLEQKAGSAGKLATDTLFAYAPGLGAVNEARRIYKAFNGE